MHVPSCYMFSRRSEYEKTQKSSVRENYLQVFEWPMSTIVYYDALHYLYFPRALRVSNSHHSQFR